MKNIVHIVMIFVLATSISAFAASQKPDAPKAPDANNAAVEAKTAPCPADQEINQEKSCVICQLSPEDSKEKSDRQKLIEQQEKEWLKNLVYSR